MKLKKIILALKNGAPGPDNIPAGVIKHVLDVLAFPLTHICQLSLDQGYFPHELKCAKIIPLYKCKDAALFNNYRPISLLSVFSKIFEKIMYDRLYDYLVKFSILYTYQFGFQKNKSTHLAIICLLDKLVSALEKGEVGIGIFIDFRKAFDTVDHTILLEKLYFYGIRGIAYKWLSNYLSNRTQFVEYYHVKSALLRVQRAVPQGSNLGPLLFLMYINDLAFVSPKLFAVLFADDSNFFCTGKNIHDLIDIVNNELVNIVDWLNANKMSLNIEKTHYIIFCNRGKVIGEVGDVLINGCKISKVYNTKFLGMIIDGNLMWKYHIDYICNKISKTIGIILKARKIFSHETLNMLYYCFIYPYVNYCVHIWGSTYISYLTKLLVLQKRIVRIISGVPRLTHTEPLFVKLGILTVNRLFKYNIGLLMYKYHHSMLPPVLDMFVKNCQVHSYNTRQSDHLHVPKCRTELSKMSFKYQAVKVWNHIYHSVDVNIGIGTFNRHLKSHLLSIISWTIIVSTVCAFPLYVFRIYWSTRHDLITGAPYALFCTLTLAPWIEYVYQLWGHINIIVSAPFVTVSVLCCICIVYCKAYCGNKLLFCSVLFCSVQRN